MNTVLDLITNAGDAGISSSQLYSILTGKMSRRVFNKLIAALVKTGKITNEGHLLKVV